MKVLKYLSFAVLLLCFASCGKGDENSVTLKVETELGPLADYIKVTDQEVVVKMSDEKEDGADCKVITSSLALEVIKSVASNYSFHFDAVVLDKDHVEIGTLPSFDVESIYDSDNGDLSDVLLAGSLRAQMKDSDKVAEITPEDQEELNKIFKEGAYIVIKPIDPDAKFEEYKGKSSNAEVVESSDDTITEDEDIAVSSSSSSSQDWDAMLDSYEEYVDNYISLLKKAANGDRSAMAEYPALMKKAQEFGNEMKNAQGSMSASQLARYTKISTKMLKAAQEMR
ncbi:MAG: DUF6591 domain-containing protein [Muribaculaceae bacterium]|nr:DUF6591 domain-containing protein [Muribaculaceae bacterium]